MENEEIKVDKWEEDSSNIFNDSRLQDDVMITGTAYIHSSFCGICKMCKVSVFGISMIRFFECFEKIFIFENLTWKKVVILILTNFIIVYVY